jgi:hypothetical protein
MATVAPGPVETAGRMAGKECRPVHVPATEPTERCGPGAACGAGATCAGPLIVWCRAADASVPARLLRYGTGHSMMIAI